MLHIVGALGFRVFLRGALDVPPLRHRHRPAAGQPPLPRRAFDSAPVLATPFLKDKMARGRVHGPYTMLGLQ